MSDTAPATPVTEWHAPLRELQRRLAPQGPQRLVVGLTGGIGSGKTVATDELQRLGAGVVDADLAARLVVQPGRPALREIAQRYGERILLDDGGLDRRALREIVFADEAERSWLNGVTHPRIGEEIRAQLEGHRGAYGVLVSPLLFEAGQADACHLTVGVHAPMDSRLRWAARRDDTTEAAIQTIVDTQMSDADRLARIDLSLRNEGDLQGFVQRVRQLHEAILWLTGRVAK